MPTFASPSLSIRRSTWPRRIRSDQCAPPGISSEYSGWDDGYKNWGVFPGEKSDPPVMALTSQRFRLHGLGKCAWRDRKQCSPGFLSRRVTPYVPNANTRHEPLARSDGVDSSRSSHQKSLEQSYFSIGTLAIYR